MTSIPPLVICSILAPLLTYVLLQYAWRRVIRYRIMPFHVGVSIFGLTVCKTAVTDILEARKVRFRELLPWNNSKSIGWCRLGNRFYGDGILIVRRKGLFKEFVITPDDPQDFLRALNQRLTNLPAHRRS